MLICISPRTLCVSVCMCLYYIVTRPPCWNRISHLNYLISSSLCPPWQPFYPIQFRSTQRKRFEISTTREVRVHAPRILDPFLDRCRWIDEWTLTKWSLTRKKLASRRSSWLDRSLIPRRGKVRLHHLQLSPNTLACARFSPSPRKINDTPLPRLSIRLLKPLHVSHSLSITLCTCVSACSVYVCLCHSLMNT